MEKHKLKLFEIRDLNAEINGLVNMQTGEKLRGGLLDEELTMTQKYWLTDLGKKAKTLTDEVEPLRQELIQKWETRQGRTLLKFCLGKKRPKKTEQCLGSLIRNS